MAGGDRDRVIIAEVIARCWQDAKFQGEFMHDPKTKLKEAGHRARIEGLEACDWVLIDAGDIIVHVFRPEVREFYNLEKMWSAERPGDQTAH